MKKIFWIAPLLWSCHYNNINFDSFFIQEFASNAKAAIPIELHYSNQLSAYIVSRETPYNFQDEQAFLVITTHDDLNAIRHFYRTAFMRNDWIILRDNQVDTEILLTATKAQQTVSVIARLATSVVKIKIYLEPNIR